MDSFRINYEKLLHFKTELFSTDFLLKENIQFINGKTVRAMIIKGHLCSVPVDLLEKESVLKMN